MALERLDKLLAAQGMESRREVKEKIRRGLVLVNGAAARSPDLKIDPDRDQVTVEGVPILLKKNLYLMLNKPQGVVSATEVSNLSADSVSLSTNLPFLSNT